MAKNRTVMKFINACKKNGYPKLKGLYFKYKDEILPINYKRFGARLGEACAIGQISQNTGIEPNNVENYLRHYYVKTPKILILQNRVGYETIPLNLFIRYLNDYTDLSVTEIGEMAEKAYLESLEAWEGAG